MYTFKKLGWIGRMKTIERIDESNINRIELIGNSCNDVEFKIKTLIDFMFSGNYNKEMFDFFDIRGTILLHGIPGVGKTSIAKNVMKYVIDKYGVESYIIEPSDIIVSGLGETVKNLSDSLKKFEELEAGILFIDEIDKFCVNRNDEDELSEMKRLLIELMSFIDKLSVSSNKIMICCTNVFEQMDSAIQRRFSICEKIMKPSSAEKKDFFRLCYQKTGSSLNVEINDSFISTFETMDSIKAYFRKKILTNKLITIENDIESYSIIK